MATRVLTALALLVLIGWGIRAARPTGELRDYGSFIASGRAGAQGQNPYGIYPLTFHVVLPQFEVWNPNLNPPVSIPVFAFFDRVDPQRGFRLWWVFSMMCYLAAVALLVARRPGALRDGRWLLPLWALALAGFWDTLALGQIYLPLVLAAVGSWLLLQEGRPLPAGILMGIVVAVKPNFGVWPALLLLAGHWRAPLAAGVTAAALSAMPLAIYGMEIYRQWVALILADESRAAFLTNASFAGLAQRAGAGVLGTVVSVGLLLALAAWAFRRRPDVMRASALGILGGIVASPIAWVHYTLFLLPAFFAARMTAPLVLAAALLTVPVPLLLELLDAPAWQQATMGSAYNWAVLLALFGFATSRRESEAEAGVTLVFYDGVCGLCDRLIHFLLARDTRGALRFAQLQGAVARRELLPAGYDPGDLDTVLVIANWGTPRQHVLARSRAVLHAGAQLGGSWAALARLGQLVPRVIADAAYDVIARRRYSMFGRFQACPLPRPEWRSRFIDETSVSH